LTVIAEKGSVRIGGEYMNKIEYQLLEDAAITFENSGSANDYGFYKGSMSNHDKIYENMMLALKNDSHPFSYAFDGLKTVEAIEKIYQTIPLT
jgi:UDP-N-acetyl-2-amino-2-deoxyglucuronate dehydrogenase